MKGVGEGPKKPSGEHPAMREANRMIDESREKFLPMLKQQTERLAQATDPADQTPPQASPCTTCVRISLETEWSMTICGNSPLQNAPDAKRMVAEFVQAMKVAGHTIVSATFDQATAEDVNPHTDAAAPKPQE